MTKRFSLATLLLALALSPALADEEQSARAAFLQAAQELSKHSDGFAIVNARGAGASMRARSQAVAEM